MADSTIGSLPAASTLNDSSLLVVEQLGAAMKLTGLLLKQYCQNAIAAQVAQAKASATTASTAANAAEVSAEKADASKTAAVVAQNAAETARTATEVAQAAAEAARAAAEAAALLVDRDDTGAQYTMHWSVLEGKPVLTLEPQEE